MSRTAIPASFRDPAGFVWTEGDKLFRQVNDCYRESYDALMSSGLYSALVSAELLIPHEEDSAPAPGPGGYKVLRPEKVDFISYPYEWCFGQLLDAALVTLQIQDVALDYGMTLRDASAYNIQFHRGKPTMIDTLSFAPLEVGRPWIGYRQFCQHFLAPLALMAYGDVRLGALLRTYVDGVPLDLASSILPRRTRLKPSLQLHIHAHARSQRKYQSRDVSARVNASHVSFRALKGLVASLRKASSRLGRQLTASPWSRYYEEMSHYTEESLERKKRVLAALLDQTGGSLVWDLGANVGLISREASNRGMTTICFDCDAACVEANYLRVKAEGEERILPLVCDLTNPSPGLGWAHRERSSLRDRGPADVVMVLALLHHIAIGNNVPLGIIAEFLAEIGRTLIIEFVPKTDPMVKRLLASRRDIFANYSQEGFEQGFESRFVVERRQPISESGRMLYLMRAK